MMQPTRLPDDRRARHEATGEWPQPSLWTMLAARVRATPGQTFLIEGQREGGRSYTFADLAARAERMAGGLARIGQSIAFPRSRDDGPHSGFPGSER